MYYTKAGKLCLNSVDLTVLRRCGTDLTELTEKRDGPPVITSPRMLALLIEHPETMRDYASVITDLMRISNAPEQHYTRFKLKSASGKERIIQAPWGMLRYYSRWILNHILSEMPIDDHAVAYRKGYSLRDATRPHIGRRYLVKTDLKAFYDHCTAPMVFRLFRQYYPVNVATILTKLTTVNGCLPQGAPASPALSNLLLAHADRVIADYCAPLHIRYTRYSDDLIFSSDIPIDTKELLGYLMHTLRRSGNFELNFQKTVAVGPSKKHRVLGLTVNEKLAVDRNYKRDLRQQMYYVQRVPLAEHILRQKNPVFLGENGKPEEQRYLRSLLGKVNYVLHYQPDSQEFRTYCHYLRSRLDAYHFPGTAPFYGQYERLACENGMFEIRDNVLMKYHGKGGAVTIPRGVTKIGLFAFGGQKGLTAVTFPDTVREIGERAFSGCTGLKEIVFPEGVEKIGSSSFDGCTGLDRLVIPASLTEIDDTAFWNCRGIDEIRVKEENPAFYSKDGVVFTKDGTKLLFCSKSKQGTFPVPVGVKAIDGFAFSGCTGLTALVLPSSVTELRMITFWLCKGLKDILVDGRNPKYCSKNGVLYSKDGTSLLRCPLGKTGAIVIPEGVTSIGEDAFWKCAGLTSITIPESVTQIGEESFCECPAKLICAPGSYAERYISEQKSAENK